MRKVRISLLVVMAALLVFTNLVSANASAPTAFMALLSGANEVPARQTSARGAAGFLVKEGGSEVFYKLAVLDIKNVTASHIHCAAAGVNGPVGVTLYRGSAGSGKLNGVIASGTLTAPDAGNACGWVTMQDVVSALASGNAYVNVHTNDGVDPTNTGPGDFPGGEIRGQVEVFDPGKLK